ncbi:MAG TPA: hypothetical protein PKH77_08720 [Anaerolineae bacterium]|nr:hypothetical protein [Anaerolineae bacterium]
MMPGSERHQYAFGLFLALILLMACQLAGRRAAPPETLVPGDTTHVLTHDGLERSYIVHIPPATTRSSRPRL